MYPAAEGRSPAILNWLRHIGIWVQFTAPKVLTWSHLPCTGYSRRLMSTLSSLTLETFYRIRRPLSSTSQGSISTFMSILLGRALNSYLKLSSSVHCVARSDSASNPRWISVKKKNISKIYVSMHLDSESSYKKSMFLIQELLKQDKKSQLEKYGNMAIQIISESHFKRGPCHCCCWSPFLHFRHHWFPAPDGRGHPPSQEGHQVCEAPN